MRCYVNSMLLLKLGIIHVFRTFLLARFLRNLLFLHISKTPPNAVRDQNFGTMDLKTGGYIFLSLGGLEKKYLCSGSGTQICNVIQDILVHYSFSLIQVREIVVETEPVGIGELFAG